MLDLAGTVAVVTGGGIGIGAATASILAAYGAKVAVCDVAEEVASDSSARIGGRRRSGTGGSCRPESCEPQTAEDIGEMVAFLASDKAKNITGSAFNVAGGMEMR